MGIPEWIAIISVVVALASVAVQQHLTRQQSKAEARDRHYDRTQALLIQALRDPDLLEAISGISDEDQKHRRYRQLWFNHVEMFFRNQRLFDKPHWKGTINDIRGFMNMPVMLVHWARYKHFYADDFQKFIDMEIVVKLTEAPVAEAPAENGQASIT